MGLDISSTTPTATTGPATVDASDAHLKELKDQASAIFAQQGKEMLEKKVWSDFQDLYKKHHDAFKRDDRATARKIREAVENEFGADIANDLLNMYLLQAAQRMSPQERGTFLRNAYEEEMLLAMSDVIANWIYDSANRTLGTAVADELAAKSNDPDMDLSPAPMGPSDHELKDFQKETATFMRNKAKEMVDQQVAKLLSDTQLLATVESFSKEHKEAFEKGDKTAARNTRKVIEETQDLGPNFASYLLNETLLDAALDKPEDERMAFLHKAYEEELLNDKTSRGMANSILKSVGTILGEEESNTLSALYESLNPIEEVEEIISKPTTIATHKDKEELQTAVGGTTAKVSQDKEPEISKKSRGIPSASTTKAVADLSNEGLKLEKAKAKASVARFQTGNLDLKSAFNNAEESYQKALRQGNTIEARKILAHLENTPGLGIDAAEYLFDYYVLDAASKLPESQRSAYLQAAYSEEFLRASTSSIMSNVIRAKFVKLFGEEAANELGDQYKTQLIASQQAKEFEAKDAGKKTSGVSKTIPVDQRKQKKGQKNRPLGSGKTDKDDNY